MKKLFALIACVLGLTMTACSGGASSNANLLMITDGDAGVYSAYGEQIAVALNGVLGDIIITPTISGESAENIRLMNKRGADVSIVPGALLDFAYLGVEVFQNDGRLENISAIAALYPEAVLIIVPDDIQIDSVEGLKGKRVSVGVEGSAYEAGARRVLEACGLKYEDFEQVEYPDMSASIAALGQRTIDAAIVIADIDNPALAALTGVRLVPITGESASKLIAQNPYYINYTLPANAFAGKAGLAGVETVAAPVTLACRKDVDEDSIYRVTKALFENYDKITHDKATALNPANAGKGLAISLHPGADKYYKEAVADK